MNELTHKFITNLAYDYSGLSLNRDILISSSVKPDEDETTGAFMWHFYNPATKKNYKGGRVSALTKLLEHYDKSLSTVGIDEIKSTEELGRACHFIQDMCTPVHTYYEDTFDAVYRLSQHQHFEKYTDDLIKQNIQSINLNEIPKRFFQMNDLKMFAKYLNLKASEDFNTLNKFKDKIEEVSISSVGNAILGTCSVLLHFRNENAKEGN